MGPKIWHICVFNTVDFLSFLHSESVGSDNPTFPAFCPVPRKIAGLPQPWGQQLLLIMINNLVTSDSVLFFQPYNICETIPHINTPLFKMPILVSVALVVNKRVWNAVLGCSRKNNRMICSFPRQTIQYDSNPSLYPKHESQRSCSWMVLWRHTRLPRTKAPAKCPFHIGDWNTKIGSQKIPGVIGKFDLRTTEF